MKKKVNLSAEIAQSMNESKVSKGAKVSNSVTSMNVTITKKETECDFISFVVSNEEISVSKFFKLFNEFKIKFPLRYANYISTHKLNLETTYDYIWFKENCPKIKIGENEMFAKWVKVTEKVSANENESYNRKTEKGVMYTLVPFQVLRANYEQFLTMFKFVISDLQRIERERRSAERKAEKDAKQAEKEQKQMIKAIEQAETIFKEVSEISANNSIPFDTALKVYTSLKGVKVSDKLLFVLEKMQKESKK